jgi:hypothetical protein
MAHRPKVEHLSDKHWKALELISEGERNMANVARSIGMDPTNFHALLNGNVEKMGNVASVFQREYAKVLDEKLAKGEKKVNALLQSSQTIALEVLERQLAIYHKKDKLTKDDEKMVTYLTKALAVLKPPAPRSMKVSQTWNYTKGLTPQELEHEFSRLRGLSQGPPNAGGVRQIKQGGSGVLHPSAERGSEAEEIPEDPGLSADGEAA